MDEWRLLTTLSDAPSTQALADLLRAEGVSVRVISEAHLLGAAVPCRLMVEAQELQRAHWLLRQRTVSEAELLFLATGESPTGGSE
jgi:hypothetical protein